MDINKSSNPFIFASILTVVVALLLSLTATQLREKIAYNIEVDKKKYIIKSIGVNVSEMTQDDIVNEYKKIINEFVIDSKGNEVANLKIGDLYVKEDKALGSFIYTYNNNFFYPLYKSENAIIIPISGKGLWSTLYGYLALDIDMETVKGITFYKHGETPGLGAEVAKTWFQDNFIGKKIFDNKNNLISITVARGKADPNDNHEVDGISGATVTSNGVTKFLKYSLSNYQLYFENNR